MVQQDKTTYHKMTAIIRLLCEKISVRIISRFGNITRHHAIWCLRLFSWGYAKGRVYTDKPQTWKHPKKSIRQAAIEPEIYKTVIEKDLGAAFVSVFYKKLFDKW